MRSPLKWHGGKSYLAKKIINLFTPHKIYIELFLGGGSILLNKYKSEIEIANDLDSDLINFWQTLKDKGLENDYKYTKENFERSKDCKDAQMYLIRNRFSRGGLGREFAWSERLRGRQPGDVNAWETIQVELPRIKERIKDTIFLNQNAIDIVKDHNTYNTLIYCDPPYLPETRSSPNIYKHELTIIGHENLLNCLLNCKSKIFISGYSNHLYNTLLYKWRRHEFQIANHSGQNKEKQKRTEVLWESI